MIRQVVYRVLDKRNFKYYYCQYNQLPKNIIKDDNFWISKIADKKILYNIPSITNTHFLIDKK